MKFSILEPQYAGLIFRNILAIGIKSKKWVTTECGTQCPCSHDQVSFGNQ
ncbi:hypothetical protein CNE_BB1p12490 (plasmid) [Cupriavidus necator N-1]|uniref:Uncharacterized protein n=1 Tax=Cupriavidus necator (strain ATCC 43291 / DSM 13513 / CCUG 52238 / LMG 8453 / N-1) TaxID=1042878 RepID=F8GVM8_CUPNN|nr:hypothetical protein CNE_BB1p12490 [Cupriavidus necator N-1]